MRESVMNALLTAGNKTCENWDASALAPGERITRIIIWGENINPGYVIQYSPELMVTDPEVIGRPAFYTILENKLKFWPVPDTDYTMNIHTILDPARYYGR